MTPRRILVVAGARALDRTIAGRRWAYRALALRLFSPTALFDTLAHGDCAGVDRWADDLARVLWLDCVLWPLGQSAQLRTHISPNATGLRSLRNADNYPYSKALERNAAMARWAGDQQAAGHHVVALTLRCGWPLCDGERATQGTAHARDRLVAALGAEHVTDLECPTEFGPKDGAA